MREAVLRLVRAAALVATGGLVAAASVVPAAASPADERGQPPGTTRLISRDLDGKPARPGSGSSSVSDDGRFVAYFSAARELTTGPPCLYHGCIYLNDRSTGLTTRVTAATDGGVPNGAVYAPSISGDGRYVGNSSEATNLVADDTNGKSDVFVYDREGELTELVSRNPDGQPANGYSYRPELSSDGQVVVWESESTDLVPGDTNGVEHDVFRLDRAAGVITVVGLNRDGDRAALGSHNLAVDDAGRRVAFESESSDFVRDDENGGVRRLRPRHADEQDAPREPDAGRPPGQRSQPKPGDQR